MSIMPKVIYDHLNHGILVSTSMCLRLVDQLIRRPIGTTEDILVKTRDSFIPMDFVVLKMDDSHRTPLIVGGYF